MKDKSEISKCASAIDLLSKSMRYLEQGSYCESEYFLQHCQREIKELMPIISKLAEEEENSTEERERIKKCKEQKETK